MHKACGVDGEGGLNLPGGRHVVHPDIRREAESAVRGLREVYVVCAGARVSPSDVDVIRRVE